MIIEIRETYFDDGKVLIDVYESNERAGFSSHKETKNCDIYISTHATEEKADEYLQMQTESEEQYWEAREKLDALLTPSVRRNWG